MAYGSINADVIGTSVQGYSLGAGNSSLMKNKIINGAMVISQYNGTSSVTPAKGQVYNIDRWNTQLTAASTGVISVQQVSDAPTGFVNSEKITVTTADTSVPSSTQYNFAQFIEGYNIADLGFGTASAKTITLSFWVKSSVTGTFSVGLTSGDGGRGYPTTYTVSVANTWEQKSVTIAGDTSGTWVSTNANGMRVIFDLGVGSSLQGTANTWQSAFVYAVSGSTRIIGTLNATIQFTGVQLEVGSSATGFEYRQYQQELALCQRYCYAQDNRAGNSFFYFGVGAGASSTAAYSMVTYPVTMRIKPSVTLSAGNTFFIDPGVTNFTGSIIDQASPIGGVFSLTGGSGLTAGLTGRCLSNSTAAAFVIWTAEL